jgi:hypothetical protein
MNELMADGNTIVGDWHTHGAGSGFDDFSPEDLAFGADFKRQASPKYVGMFLGTPSGKILYHRVGTLGNDPEAIMNMTFAQRQAGQSFIRKIKRGK